jgi:uncharacterized protein (DUF927 family)
MTYDINFENSMNDTKFYDWLNRAYSEDLEIEEYTPSNDYITLEEMADAWAKEIAEKADTIEWMEITASGSASAETLIGSISKSGEEDINTNHEGIQCQDMKYELYTHDSNGNNDALKGYLKVTSERPLKAYLLEPDGKTPLTDPISVQYVNEFEQVLRRPLMDVLNISEADAIASISNIYKQVKTNLGIDDFYKMWKGACLPYAYKVVNGNLIKTTTQYNPETRKNELADVVFTPTPIIISRIGRDVDNKDYWIEVTLEDIKGNEVKVLLPQDELFGKAGIKKLMRKGLVFTEGEYKEMNKYLLCVYELNANSLQELVTASSYGWKENNSYFVLGDRAISHRGVQEAKVVGMDGITTYEKKGTLDGWVKGVEDIVDYALTRVKLYAAAAAVILDIVVQNSFILHNMGPSGGAKSTTAMVAMSMFGKPRLKDAKSTQKGSALLNQINPNLPLIYDEIGDDPKKANNFKEQIYDLVNGNERATSDLDLRLRMSKRFKTVIQSVGEIGLVDDGDYEGMHVRVITIDETLEYLPFIKDLEKALAANYGHVGDLYIQKVLKYKDRLPEWYDKYYGRFPHYDTTQAGRVKGYFAAMAVAGDVLEEVFKDIGLPSKEPYAICEKYYTKVANEKPIEKFHIQMLRKAYTWFISNKARFQHEELTRSGHTQECVFNGKQSTLSPMYGWYSDQYIDFLPGPLEEYFNHTYGVPIKSAYNEWINEGIMVVDKGRKQAKPYKIMDGKKRPVGVTRIVRDKLECALGLDGPIPNSNNQDIDRNNDIKIFNNILKMVTAENKGVALLDEIYSIAECNGISKQRTSELIKRMGYEGTVFLPTTGKLRLV